jgi:cytochrome c biogenesis protein CcmG/thiol:disulfide interchange protein DsbE
VKRLAWLAVIVVPVLALLAFGLRRDPNAEASPLLNKPAPSFTLRALDGREVSLSALRGRPVVLNFWASWCVSCRAEHSVLLQAWRQYRSRVNFVGVLFQDTSSDARGYMRQLGGGWPSVEDPTQNTAIGYGVAGPPETFLIDRHGVVRFKAVGPLAAGTLQRQLTVLLRGT